MGATPTVVAGRYQLLRQLGSGGMGQVWLARDEMLDRHVAIKQVVLPPGLSADESLEARFRTLREARTAAQLNHPSVVKIYDVVQTEEQPWIVMEYIPSRSLHEILAEDGPLDPVQVAKIGLAVLDALTAAHEAGVLHRDVKPGNVLLAQDGRVVLTDFGLATFDGVESAVTVPGLVFGSVRFVAPERARDGTSSPESDLWALGATLYAAVEGHSPYARSSAMETLTALATALPDPPRRAGPLKPILAGLLRRNPKHRLRPEDARRLLQRVANDEKPGVRVRLIPRQLQRRLSRADQPAGPVVPSDPGKAPTVVLAPRTRSSNSDPLRPPRPPHSSSGDPLRPPGTRSSSGDPLRPPRPPQHLSRTIRRPWFVIVATVAAALLVGAVSVLVASAHEPGTRPGADPPLASAAADAADPFLGSDICPTVNATGFEPASRQPGWDALIAGWAWYRDPNGFRIAVPDGWRAYAGPGGMCFRGAGDGRWLGITSWSPGSDPMAHVIARERDLLHASPPTGYQQIRVAAVPYYRGGADWEFVFRSRDGVLMHGDARDFVVAPGRGYTIVWCTTEFDWTTNLANFQLVMASFHAS
ncbi:MAG: hypothetical protein AUI14_23070 [Actinobacteria bacterium 13_2_20CM_2_71_6]|nr:MAG: hypothetical protein AUI14_23070 [Actinobacteria bacterium 13_2_20CM_2_71_6]